MKLALWVVGVLIAVSIGLVLIRQPILEGHLFPSIRPLYMLIAPPADLCQPLVLVPAVLDNAGSRYRLSFQHKYAGTHEFGIRVENRIPMPVQPYDRGGRFSATFLADGRALITETVGASPSPWWTHDANGFTLLHYEVPADLPLGQTIECEVIVMESRQRFHSTYGKASFYARKSSEK